MVASIVIAVLSAATVPFWIRFTYRLLNEAAEEPTSAYQRSFERARLRDSGTLNWSLGEGETAAMPLAGVNISKGGALVETKSALPVGTVVLIHFGSLRTMTTATVRHCTPWGSRFRIGVAFRHPLIAAETGRWEVIVQPAVS